MKKNILIIFFTFCIFSFINASVHAASFDLIAPDTLVRDQDNKFIININTQGQLVKDITVGVSYEAAVIQFLRAEAGNTFPSISTEMGDTGVLYLSGSNANGFNGTGLFANIYFKLIATAPGRTQLCSLFVPSPAPTSTPRPSSTPAPTTPPVSPTPRPTALPKTGSTDKVALFGLVGGILISLRVMISLLKDKKHHEIS